MALVVEAARIVKKNGKNLTRECHGKDALIGWAGGAVFQWPMVGTGVVQVGQAGLAWGEHWVGRLFSASTEAWRWWLGRELGDLWSDGGSGYVEEKEVIQS